MKIISKKENQSIFTQSWLEYQGKNVTGLGYSLEIIQYHLITNQDFLLADESFVVMGEAHDKTCLAICFLPIYKGEYLYSSAVAPLAYMKKNLKICFNQVDIISQLYKLSKIEFSIDSCYSQEGQWQYNYLRDYGYIDCTGNNYIFNLNNKPEELFKQFNTSSRNIIRKSLKNNNISMVVYDSKTISLEVFNQYKKFHFICAGFQTRSDKSFSYMNALIDNNQAVLLELNYKNQPIGYLLVFVFYPYACLSSIANLPDYERSIPIYRLLYWKAIEYCSNYKIIIYGYPAGNSLVDGYKSYMDTKQLEIAKYKSYMGGKQVAEFKGVKYFDIDIARQEIDSFKNRVVNECN